MLARLLSIAVATALVGCGENLTEPTADPADGSAPIMLSATAGSGTPALVVNPGEGKDNPRCRFGAFGTSNDGTFVRTPNGRGVATCRLRGLDPIARVQRVTGFECFLNLGGLSFTNQSFYVRTPAGMLTATCIFES